MKTFDLKMLFLVILLTGFIAKGVQADETALVFIDGINHYKNENFKAAISDFSKIIDTGIQNGKLFYNLGNAYLKNGDLGKAILWYERALKLIPEDPDLKFNHAYALSQLKDEAGDVVHPVVRVLFFWKYILSVKTIQWSAIILNLIFWTILILKIVRKNKSGSIVTGFILVFSILFSLTALYNFYEKAFIEHGIILPSKVSIRSGLTDDSTELFVLHAGTKVKIEKEFGACFKICFSSGKIGWVKKSAVGII